jgi:hypothetical protein
LVEAGGAEAALPGDGSPLAHTCLCSIQVLSSRAGSGNIWLIRRLLISESESNLFERVRSEEASKEIKSETMLRQVFLLPLLMIALAGLARAQGTAKSQADAKIEKEVLQIE